jgi:hypothetical protein
MFGTSCRRFHTSGFRTIALSAFLFLLAIGFAETGTGIGNRPQSSGATRYIQSRSDTEKLSRKYRCGLPGILRVP